MVQWMRAHPEKNSTAALQCEIALPKQFRLGDVLSFHRRDAQMVAERVEAAALHKGLLWDGSPACLTIRFESRFVAVELAIDGSADDDDGAALSRMVRRMLGLTQRVEEFEAIYHDHSQLGPLIARNPGLRVPLTPTPFEALTWAITGQQITVGAATSIRRKLIQAAGQRHSSGLWCYPDARRILATTEKGLREAGYSQTKARAMIALSEQIERGVLPLDEWADTPPVEEIRARLLRIRGIGPWTVEYALLRGFGWMDGSLHGDAAIRRNLQIFLKESEKIKPDEAQKWLFEFSPWRALVAAHLWAMQTTDGY